MNYPDDDDGFVLGAFEEEQKPKVKASKRDTRTRAQRPISEWTPNDVLAEFRARVEQRCPALRNLLPLRKNGAILASMRKKHETTPYIELALIDLYLMKGFDSGKARRNPDYVFLSWFTSWTRNLDEARHMVDNAPQEALYAPEKVEDDKSYVPATSEAPRGLLRASDGREFPRTITGRKRLENYEKRITNG